jgi:hypothetical protein
VVGQDKERAALEMAGMFFIPRGREFETMLLIHIGNRLPSGTYSQYL